jgi:heme A synthase
MFAAPALVALQITLGIFTVLTLRAVPVAVAHFAGAAALWGLWSWSWFSTAGAGRATVVRPALAPVRGVHAVP